MMHGREKSDSAIVAEKPTNKVVSATAEPVEPRAGAKGNASQQSTLRTQCRKCVSQALERIRQVRRHSPKVGAVCGNSARTDLGGGRSVMTVPTALRTESSQFDPDRTLGFERRTIASEFRYSFVVDQGWPRRNCIISLLTSSGCSSSTQWPAPST